MQKAVGQLRPEGFLKFQRCHKICMQEDSWHIWSVIALFPNSSFELIVGLYMWARGLLQIVWEMILQYYDDDILNDNASCLSIVQGRGILCKYQWPESDGMV